MIIQRKTFGDNTEENFWSLFRGKLLVIAGRKTFGVMAVNKLDASCMIKLSRLTDRWRG